MPSLTLTINQGFQLAALLPCLLVIFYLALNAPKNFSSILLPVIYFACLSSGFLIPLYGLLPDFPGKNGSLLLLEFAESSLQEVSFLLIMQFIKQKLPDLKYFLILAIPLIGGAPFTYLKFKYSQVCFTDTSCVNTEYLFIIYHVVTASLVFLLLLFSIGRIAATRETDGTEEKARYWLIISMVLFNLADLGVDLARIYRGENPSLLFTDTMIGVAFIYLALCSIFRVFNQSFDIKPVTITLWEPADRDHVLADKIHHLIVNEKLYLQPGFSRRSLAEKLSVNETTLSRVINWKFEKPFRELINHYRIEEAKRLLSGSQKPVTIVAYESGFKSITSFNRVFKEVTTMSATEFRADRRKAKPAAPVSRAS